MQKLIARIKPYKLYYKTIPLTYVLVTIGYLFDFLVQLPFMVMVKLDQYSDRRS